MVTNALTTPYSQTNKDITAHAVADEAHCGKIGSLVTETRTKRSSQAVLAVNLMTRCHLPRGYQDAKRLPGVIKASAERERKL